MPILGVNALGPRQGGRELWRPSPSPIDWRLEGDGAFPTEPGTAFVSKVVGAVGQVSVGFVAAASALNAFAQALTAPIIASAGVSVQYQGGTFPGSDWVAWVPAGEPTTSYLPGWSFVPATSGTVSIPAPSIPGQYDLIYLVNGGFATYSRLTYTVQAPASVDVVGLVSLGFAGVAMAANHSVKSLTSPILVGQVVSVEYFGGLFPGADWVTFAPAGSSVTTFLAGWSNTSQRDGVVNVTAPPTAGSYEIRFLQNNQYILYASQPVTVTVPMVAATGEVQIGFGVDAVAQELVSNAAEGLVQIGFGTDAFAQALLPVDVAGAISIGFQSSALALQHNQATANTQLGFSALALASQVNMADTALQVGFGSLAQASQKQSATAAVGIGFTVIASAASMGTATASIQLGFSSLAIASQTQAADGAVSIGFSSLAVADQTNAATGEMSIGFGATSLAEQQMPASAELQLGFSVAGFALVQLPPAPNATARIKDLTPRYAVVSVTPEFRATIEGSDGVECTYFRVTVGDQLPSFVFQLTQRVPPSTIETAIDISSATVDFVYRDLTGVMRTRPAVVTDGQGGQGRVDWLSLDFAQAGQIKGRLRVTVGGKAFTVQETVTIDVVPP